jgi:hypothetical protein
VVTYDANPTCSGSLTYDPVLHTVSATFHIVNNGPDEAGPNGSGSVTFTDTVPAPATVTGASCGNAAGGAVCGATGFLGNVVSGTIDSLPAGGSLDITINGTVPSNPGNVQLSDTFELAVNGVVVNVSGTVGEYLRQCGTTARPPAGLRRQVITFTATGRLCRPVAILRFAAVSGHA